MSEKCEHAYGGAGPCPHCRVVELEAELALRVRELRRLTGLASYAVTCRKSNTSVWMLGLLDHFRAAFPEDRFDYIPRDGVLVHRPAASYGSGGAVGVAAPTSQNGGAT